MAEHADALSPEFDRDETMVWMALAFCLAGASRRWSKRPT
jgi:hypothetical protein